MKKASDATATLEKLINATPKERETSFHIILCLPYFTSAAIRRTSCSLTASRPLPNWNSQGRWCDFLS
ncbi:MAG TPA: hypothetical protein VM487_16120 [Phycisphaerae bacterium]|nr:hypothetical protein [Phycisphaerae bacterium]HUW34308.1 hypothetical protein [Planctomycetota bacterium]